MRCGQRVTAYCVCCRGRTTLLVYGPSTWRVEIICHRCNLSECGKAERIGDADTWLREHGCRSRRDEPILRYRGRR